ncbi:hypothetical protein [Lapillicoccus sp.]|uniref:hypothetical protein n=1 Tax=Lapillicoccus sp. TaxID=1909287 RepID=UPI0032631EF7
MNRHTRRLAGIAAAAALSAMLSSCAAVAGVSDPPTATVGGAVSGSRASGIAAQVTTLAARATAAASGADGDALRAAAFTGDALTAANADAKLAATLSQAQKDALALTSAAPVVLAVSNGLSYPRQMLVQTTRAKSGLPVLSLLTTPDSRTPFRIAASATMLPSAEVPSFDQLAQGAPLLGSGAGLAAPPQKLLAAYASSLAFPAPAADANAPFEDDASAAAVRKNAQAQSDGLSGSGTLTSQSSAKDVVGGFKVADDRGALVFTVIQRKDTILNRTQATITPTAQFTALTGLSNIKAEATLDTLEFVVFVVPASGQARVVAAQEHLVAATGT